MKKNLKLVAICLAMGLGVLSCKDDKSDSGLAFDPSKPIQVTGFYPQSGGVATPMIMDGENFGTDTLGLKVYFEDSLGVRHRAGLVSSNGNKIYMFVPSGLTFKKNMNLLVERTLPDGQVYSGKAEEPFVYKTQTTVTTVVGQASPDAGIPTKGGDLSTATLSAPVGICLDNDDNIFITEREFDAVEGRPDVFAKNEKGDNVQGNIVMASLKSNTVTVLQYGTPNKLNAPAYSDIPGEETVYVPDDTGMKFYQLVAAVNYVPRYKTLLKTEETKTIDEGNWKHSFVVNKMDRMVYTVMWKGQLVRMNPRNRTAEILLTKVGEGSSDSYITFSPLPGEENVLYVCEADNNAIWRVDVGDLADKDRDNYHGEPYAGKALIEGKQAGKGWEDGLLKNAKFNHPRQICFTSDGKLYIADTGNSCIRMIDTTIKKERATVTTPIGLPGNRGYKDGGPEIAQFDRPCGVAVSADGKIVYVADSHNKVIRKLSIE